MRKADINDIDPKAYYVSITREGPRSEEMVPLTDIPALLRHVAEGATVEVDDRRQEVDRPAPVVPDPQPAAPIDLGPILGRLQDLESRVAAAQQPSDKMAGLDEAMQRITGLEARLVELGLKQGLTDDVPLHEMPGFLAGHSAMGRSGPSEDAHPPRLSSGPEQQIYDDTAIRERLEAIESGLSMATTRINDFEAGLNEALAEEERRISAAEDAAAAAQAAVDIGSIGMEEHPEPPAPVEIIDTDWRGQLVARIREAGKAKRNESIGDGADQRDISRRMVEMAYRARNGNVRSIKLISIVAEGLNTDWDAVARAWIANYEAGDRVIARTLSLEEGAIQDIAMANREEAERIADQILEAIGNVNGEVDDDDG